MLYPVNDPAKMDEAISIYIMKSNEIRYYTKDVSEAWKAANVFQLNYPQAVMKVRLSPIPTCTFHPRIKPATGHTLPHAICRALLIAQEAFDRGTF